MLVYTYVHISNLFIYIAFTVITLIISIGNFLKHIFQNYSNKFHGICRALTCTRYRFDSGNIDYSVREDSDA